MTEPRNDDDIGSSGSQIDFIGYTGSASQTVRFYYSKNGASGWTQFHSTVSASSSLGSLHGVPGYEFDTDDSLPDAAWTCLLDGDGTAQTYVKAVDITGPDEDLFTFDASLNLWQCAVVDSSTIQEVEDDCVSADSPVVRLTAERASCFCETFESTDPTNEPCQLYLYGDQGSGPCGYCAAVDSNGEFLCQYTLTYGEGGGGGSCGARVDVGANPGILCDGGPPPTPLDCDPPQ